MCKFTFTLLECGHRGRDHIDTSSCRYFKESKIHCQDDNPEHRRRSGGVTISKDTIRIPGKCVKCIRVEQEAVARAMEESIRTAEEEARRREERKRAEDKARRKQQREADEERANSIEKKRLTKDRQRYEQNEVEQKKKRDAETRAADKRRHEEAGKTKRDAERKAERDAKLRQEKEDKKLDDARRQRELAEVEEDIRIQDELEKERIRQQKVKRDSERQEAEHQESLRRKKKTADRERAERDEAERRQVVAEERRREEAELERQQKEINEQNEALERAAQEAEEGEEDAEYAKRIARMKADIEAGERELQRKLVQRRLASETEPISPPPTEQTLPVVRPTPSSTKPAVDISEVIGHHGPQEIGHGMLGGRRIPLHESQKRPEPPKTPVSPPVKRGPAPINRLGGTIASSPHDYKIQQPSLVATPGTPTPDWKRSVRQASISRAVPTPEPTGPSSELASKLAKRKAWEASQENEDADNVPVKSEPSWDPTNAPSSSPSTPANPTSSAPQAPAYSTSTSPPPTYPVVPLSLIQR
ncbi:hypothetical protein N0V86_001257 [Didymella sp. IMI 355093]|nr:hypothetical protein N0V86_001257 [Didymella sp. IMI 355093]